MKAERFVAVADPHGDEIDPICERAFFRWLDGWKPDVVFHVGDNWNFAAIRKGASPEDKRVSLASDLEAGVRFFERLFAHGSRRFFLRGNHDERLWDMLDSNDAVYRELAERGTRQIEGLCRRHRVKMLPYDVEDGVLEYGKLRIVHGYAHGQGAAAKHARAYGHCLFGHTHTQDVMPVENVGAPAVALGIGCLLKTKQTYARANMSRLRHQNGWVYGLIFPDGTHQIFQAKRIGDSFYAATSIEKV